MTGFEQWNQYNIAEHGLAILVGDYSERMYLEGKKDAPDPEQIKKWLDERMALSRLRRSLSIKDMAAIERVHETWVPMARDIIQQKKRQGGSRDPLHKLSQEEQDATYAWIAGEYWTDAGTADEPRAIITGGQPFSGKSLLTRQAEEELKAFGASVRIDVNDLRDKHPQYNPLQIENDREAASLVHPDASCWADRLFADAVARRLNIIVEQTCKNPASVLRQTARLRRAGYHVELWVMAVNFDFTQLRLYTKYEYPKAEYGVGRFVPPAVHQAAYAGLEETLSAVSDQYAVDVLKVYDKEQKIIAENRLVKNGR